MATKFLSARDFAQNEIQNAVMQVLAAAPSSPVAGQMYYDSTISGGSFMFRNSVGWINPRARADHTGTQLAATISDFNTAVRTNRLDQMATPTADVALGSQKITGLANPTSAQDAATKAYVDSAVNGTDWKQSVRIATTANVGLSSLTAIDGVTPVDGDRVLVKDNTDASENGIYTAASGAWTRATDFDSNAEVTSGLSVMVTEGSTNAGTQWRLNTPDPIVLGTTDLDFAQIGAGSSYTEGAGIDISGNVISIDTSVVSRKYAENIGAGTSDVITHNLNTLDVLVQVVEIATGQTVECDVTRNSVNQVTLGFAVAVEADDYRVIVQG